MPAATTGSHRTRSELTTTQLLRAARELFAARGYEATSVDDIASAAGVTKGAVYHHYAGKQDLFRAVFEQEQQVIAARLVEQAVPDTEPWEALLAGSRQWLDLILDPGIQRILLLDGPSMLGWEEVRAIEARYGLALLQAAVEGLTKGASPRLATPRLANLLFGALCEGAMTVARSEDPRRAKEEILADFELLVGSLRGP
ncbi:MAG: TetR/AcrR family transcriptional regulator [Thermoleophilaceae bacterium]|nr:TetR/AcrR family transcriptional regulator [Thermoleophilaceae bacterium]